MTDDQLKELESLDSLAVAAPWAWEKCYEMSDELGHTVRHWALVEPGRESKSVIHHQLVMLSMSKPRGEFGFLDVPEVQLLLAARNALPELLKSVRELTTLLCEARRELHAERHRVNDLEVALTPLCKPWTEPTNEQLQYAREILEKK